MSQLYIIATPIGNLEDISFRAVRILREVDLILCEDTRQTKKLLDHYQIKKPTSSYHQHSHLKKIDYIIEQLSAGKNLALVSDAGTPGISDPGNKLIDYIVTRLEGDNRNKVTPHSFVTGQAKQPSNKVTIIPIPGSCALTAIASVSGFPMDKFVFLGFPPHKNKRQKFFKELAEFEYPVVLYESPHRIIKTLEDILNIAGDRQAIVGRELTKMFETIYRGKISEVMEKIKNDKIKGEFVLIIGNK